MVQPAADRPVVRRRRPADLPALAEVLLAQQPLTGYPFRDPLPIPVETFLHAEDAAAAWTAELDGRPVGHGCRTGPLRDVADADAEPMNAACARAHDCDIDRLTWVSSLFVATEVRGTGTGRLLLEAIVADARAAGLRPCLEVLSTARGALRLYRAAGWRGVLRLRPGWLAEATGLAAGQAGPDVLVMVLPSRTPAS